MNTQDPDFCQHGVRHKATGGTDIHTCDGCCATRRRNPDSIPCATEGCEFKAGHEPWYPHGKMPSPDRTSAK